MLRFLARRAGATAALIPAMTPMPAILAILMLLLAAATAESECPSALAPQTLLQGA